MSFSSDGIAFYGYQFQAGTRNNRKLEKISESQDWNAAIKVGSHCSGDYPIYYLAAWELTARRGYPERLKAPNKKQRAELDAKLAEFLEKHNIITKKKPRLWLASYMG